MSGVMLCRIPNRCLHLRRDTWRSVSGMAAKAERTFSSLFGVILMWFSFVPISHPSTTFFFDQSVFPWRIFFVEIISFQRHSVAALCWKTVSIPHKRLQSIHFRSCGPPWQVEIKSSRYMSTWAKSSLFFACSVAQSSGARVSASPSRG